MLVDDLLQAVEEEKFSHDNALEDQDGLAGLELMPNSFMMDSFDVVPSRQKQSRHFATVIEANPMMRTTDASTMLRNSMRSNALFPKLDSGQPVTTLTAKTKKKHNRH